MLNMWRIFILFATILVAADSGAAIPEIVNFKQIAKDLKLKTFKGQKLQQKIKIAILDNGFNGYEQELGKSIPVSSSYYAGKESDADKRENTSYHGLFMAQIVHRIFTESEVDGDYELHLFNAYGYTKFTDAVETVIKDKFDIVLYSQVWEYGGNGDGKGFINAAVDKAIAAGIIWINASGNFGPLTHLTAVDSKLDGTSEWVVFKNKKGKPVDSVRVVCRAGAKKEKCNLRLVLSWNDFKNDATTGTDKDLDLYLYDSAGKKVLAAADRNQMLVADKTDSKASIIPRELIELAVEPGSYKVRVKVKSKNFSASQDKLRITASGLGIDLLPNTPDETLLAPADNPGVIVVGAADDVLTSTSKSLGLPKVFFNSLVVFKGEGKNKIGASAFGASNAAAMAAGLSVLYLATGTNKTKDDLTTKLLEVSKKKGKSGKKASAQIDDDDDDKGKNNKDDKGISLRPVERRSRTSRSPRDRDNSSRPQPGQAMQEGQACPKTGNRPRMYKAIRDVLKLGGALMVSLNGYPAVSVNYDFAARFGIRVRPGQRVFVTPNGVTALDELQIRTYGITPEHYQVVPSHVPVCPLL